MSLIEVFAAIQRVKQYDPLITDPLWSDYSVNKMKEVAKQADETDPKVETRVIVLSNGDGKIIRRAFRVEAPDGSAIIFSPTKTSLFPQQAGSVESTPILIRPIGVKNNAA